MILSSWRHWPRGQETLILDSCTCSNSLDGYRREAETNAPPPCGKIVSLAPSDMCQWWGPGGDFDSHTPRTWDECRWFAVTGRVAAVTAKRDCDIQITLEDADGKNCCQALVGIPPGEQWCKLRQIVFSWSTVDFRRPHVAGKNCPSTDRITLTNHPVIRVVGPIFYDACHTIHGDTHLNQRPAIPGRPTAAVWEIHPVMVLEELH
ncbi:MAG TPA: hypothetical protein VLZ12_08125 [Verrucomicrobiae bacterium]|nr:hypothetical protein [Verrucomicrobiae bacterium]